MNFQNFSRVRSKSSLQHQLNNVLNIVYEELKYLFISIRVVFTLNTCTLSLCWCCIVPHRDCSHYPHTHTTGRPYPLLFWEYKGQESTVLIQQMNSITDTIHRDRTLTPDLCRRTYVVLIYSPPLLRVWYSLMYRYSHWCFLWCSVVNHTVPVLGCPSVCSVFLFLPCCTWWL